MVFALYLKVQATQKVCRWLWTTVIHYYLNRFCEDVFCKSSLVRNFQKSKQLRISHLINLAVLTACVVLKRGDTSNDAIDNRFSRLVNNITSRAENETNKETKEVFWVKK